MPKGTKVSRCVEKVKKEGGNVNPYAVCQASTGESYATGESLKKDDEITQADLDTGLDDSSRPRPPRLNKSIFVPGTKSLRKIYLKYREPNLVKDLIGEIGEKAANEALGIGSTIKRTMRRIGGKIGVVKGPSAQTIGDIRRGKVGDDSSRIAPPKRQR